MMEQDIYNKSQIISHYISVWGRDYRCLRWDDGAIKELGEDFLILEFPPQKSRMMWTYATCGMANSSNKKPVELHFFSNERDEFMVELLTVVAHFHKFGKKLDLWHNVNFGRPWKPKSLCLYGLISLPYLDGPNLEILNIENKTIHFYWLIPITKEEVVFKEVGAKIGAGVGAFFGGGGAVPSAIIGGAVGAIGGGLVGGGVAGKLYNTIQEFIK